MLYILPNLLDDSCDHRSFLPSTVQDIVLSLDGLIAENEKKARIFLRRFNPNFHSTPILVLSKNHIDLSEIMHALSKGEKWGLISDAGLPVVADPGFTLIKELHKKNIAMEMVPGPCAIIQALVMSGLQGQSFTFHGYPPCCGNALKEQLRTLPKKHTHIFIEAPYRTDSFLKKLIMGLKEDYTLSVSANLTLPSQTVKTSSIKQWRKNLPQFGKVPAVFVVSCS